MPNETKRVLAVIKGVGYGCRDIGRPCLFFETDCGDGAALQVLQGKQAEKVIRDSGCYDIKNLEGKTCWVERGMGVMNFIELSGI